MTILRKKEETKKTFHDWISELCNYVMLAMERLILTRNSADLWRFLSEQPANCKIENTVLTLSMPQAIYHLLFYHEFYKEKQYFWVTPNKICCLSLLGHIYVPSRHRIFTSSLYLCLPNRNKEYGCICSVVIFCSSSKMRMSW